MSGSRTLLLIVGGIAIVILAFVGTSYVLNWSSPSSDQNPPAASNSSPTTEPSTAPTLPTTAAPPVASNGSANGIVVETATYGGSCNVKPGNATADVQSSCGGKASCSYIVDLNKLGGDPAPGCGKTFSVEYSCGADSNTKTGNLPAEANGTTVRLSCP